MEGLNLLALAAELERSDSHPDFVAKVRRATAVGSGYQDLRAANEALSLLNRQMLNLRSNSSQTEQVISSTDAEGGVICGALLAHAIILYARATETRPVDRLKWFGRSMLGTELRPFHDEVMSYRDRALAHFGLAADMEDGPAATHALVLKNPSKVTQVTIAYVETRANTRSRLTEKLTELVCFLLPIAQARYDERILEVWKSFKNDVAGRNELSGAMKRSVFTTEMLGAGPTDFFDDDESRDLSAHYTVRKQKPIKD